MGGINRTANDLLVRLEALERAALLVPVVGWLTREESAMLAASVSAESIWARESIKSALEYQRTHPREFGG